MALKSSSGPVPDGAIPLTYDQAIHYQWEQVRNWPTRWDTWAIIFGVPVISFFTGISGHKINNHYRVKLKLRRYGEATTSFAMVLTPAIVSIAAQYMIVTNELFLSRKCTICSYTNAIGIQAFSSTLYPMLLSPFANFMFAAKYGTYPLPYWSDVRGTLKLLFTLHKSLVPKLKIMLPLQVVAAFFMTYMQTKNLDTMKKKIENGEVENLPQIFF